MRLVVIGQHSFIASYLLETARAQQLEILALPHSAKLDILARNDHVVNCAVHPDFRTERYRQATDIDLKVSHAAMRAKASFTMLSTRRVYNDQAAWNAIETSPANGNETAFGQNKALSENAVAQITEGRASIFRLSNIFGYEYGASRRQTFFSRMLNNLKETGQVVFDMAPATCRDFLPVEICAEAIVRYPGGEGIYNLGCGFPVACDDIANWVLKGYQGGVLISESTKIQDEFFLNTEKWRARFGLLIDRATLEDYCIKLGQRLRCEKL